MRNLKSINRDIVAYLEEMASLEGEGVASSPQVLLGALLGAISDKLDLVLERQPHVMSEEEQEQQSAEEGYPY